MDRVKRIWYLSPMRTAKVQASLRIRAVSPEPSLLAHTSSESRGTFRQKTRSLAPLNGWACAVKICHDGMLEDTYTLDGAHMVHLEHWYIYITVHVSHGTSSQTFMKQFYIYWYVNNRTQKSHFWPILSVYLLTRAIAWRGTNTPSQCHFLMYTNNLSLWQR